LELYGLSFVIWVWSGLWLYFFVICWNGFDWNFVILEVLDRNCRCNSTIGYSGREIARGGGSKSYGRRRVSSEKCDVFSGKWVFDNASYPLYNESDCPYMSDQLACHKHGRNDLGYQHWRWQPHDCNLKRCFLFLAFLCLSFFLWA
jgi:hypothetical protein